MIKMNIFLTRRPDLTHEQFTDYWTNAHTPLLAAMSASADNTRKYVQLHGTGDTIPGLASAPMLRFGNPTGQAYFLAALDLITAEFSGTVPEHLAGVVLTLKQAGYDHRLAVVRRVRPKGPAIGAP